jgi:putative FmdB family regulatory protein
MPTYQYRCAKCGEQFDLWQSIHDDALQRHPGCGGEVTKVMAPAGIVLKGSGFYRTDSRAAGRRGVSRDKEPAKDGAGSTNGSGSDTKSKDSTSETAKKPKDTASKGTKPSPSGGAKSGSSSS